MIKKGQVYETNNHGEIVVIDYVNSKNVKVRFAETGFEMVTNAEQIKIGSVKDPMSRSVCGIGYIGYGEYRGPEHRRAYTIWRAMLYRCYKGLPAHRAYKDCTVCDEWHNFQCFAKWYYENHKEGYEVDKDILIEGNRIYSPDTCHMVTKKENLSAKSKKVIMMNGISGEIFRFRSIGHVAKSLGIAHSTASKLVLSGKCNSKGWFCVDTAMQVADILKEGE